MSEPYERGRFNAGDVNAALATFAEERRRLQQMQEKITETNTVVHSKDRVLSMTFNGRGELDKVTVNGTRFRRLAPAELAAMIKETLTSGRTQAMDKLGAMMGSDVLPGIKFTDVASGRVDVNQVVNSFLGAALKGLPDRLQERAQARLRGEL